MIQVKRFYTYLGTLICVGHAWLIVNLFSLSDNDSGFSICTFKYLTGIPCAGCGTTRASVLLLHGHFREAILLNPLSYLYILSLGTLSVLLLHDLLLKRSAVWNLYGSVNQKLNKWYLIIIFIVLTAINWAWNIQKGL